MAKSSRGKKRNKIKLHRRIMREKLAVMIIIILLAFAGLCAQLVRITNDNQVDYQKKILSQQRYDSTTLPFKRGTITDANGTILAVSEKVYNVVLDCKVMLDNKKNQAPTVDALVECFGLDRTDLDKYIKEHPTSQYYVLKKRQTYDEISPFLEREKNYNEQAKKSKTDIGKVTGVWFEEEYIRRYPNNTLACDVIGFTGSDNNGTYGLEEYYNDELNGTNGREYGYLNDDATLERTTVAAVDGNSLVSTIDANIQSIVEKYLIQFNEEHKDEFREGLGSTNSGCIVMNPNNGEILAMASYPNFDLNTPKDLSAYYTEEQIQQIQDDETYYDTLNKLWRNFCISDTYEPGSTAKVLTMAAGLETGKLTGNETYECLGSYTVADRDISCNLLRGHGVLDFSGALEQSCNVALMKMGESIGVRDLVKFHSIFNLGLKTNIDLAGEARTASLIFNENTMGPTELATSSFGQGFNVTMIEMACAFSSVINGGYYYEPHMVSKITNSSGNTVKNIEPRVLKQTVSATTSQMMREYLHATVAEGTGKTARPAGYAIGGKTGTAEKVPRDKKNYVVSFIGYAPADNPQVVIYVVIDEPNVEDQPHASYATGIVRNILTEVLPYLHIGKTEEMTITEQAEAEAALMGSVQQPEEGQQEGEGTQEEGVEGLEGEAQPTEGEGAGNTENTGGTGEGTEENTPQGAFYEVDPVTGELIDPVSGLPAEISRSYEGQIDEEDRENEE
ncbi:MAG: peptidoglycan glycosyltransferase [Lachnospiraceae bacterium]|nr:peptidoglycan glycosyltransferase [Lachnospiraceae bacterium]